MSWNGDRHRVIDAMIGLVDRRTGELRVGDAARVLGKTDENWSAVVVHVLASEAAPPDTGTLVLMEVERHRRQLLSVAHTAAHLSAFALNKALAPFWSRESAVQDSLGSPDFDREAIVSSTIGLDGAVDVYRLGKSMKRKGFNYEPAFAALASIAEAVNTSLASWLLQHGPVTLQPCNSTLDTRRLWRCALDGRMAEMFCAGTHVNNLNQIQSIDVKINGTANELTMRTFSRPVGTISAKD